MKIALLIPTLLRKPTLLAECIESISQMRVPAECSLVLYLICNTSSAELPAVVKKSLRAITFPYTVKYLGENHGFAGAMNRGAQISLEQDAGVDFFLCVNDDTYLDKNLLLEAVSTIHQSHASMIATSIYRLPERVLDSQGFALYWRGRAIPMGQVSDQHIGAVDLWHDEEDATQPFGPDAAVCFYHRDIFFKLGGFRESFFAYLEDVELAIRARQHGHICVLSEKAVAYHHKHATSSQWPWFKVQQDFLNWWRICLFTYPKSVWRQFGFLILIERARNFSGMLKVFFRHK